MSFFHFERLQPILIKFYILKSIVQLDDAEDWSKVGECRLELREDKIRADVSLHYIFGIRDQHLCSGRIYVETKI